MKFMPLTFVRFSGKTFLVFAVLPADRDYNVLKWKFIEIREILSIFLALLWIDLLTGLSLEARETEWGGELLGRRE